MLKFFRQIRQKLLSEGRMRKYVVYATGEILLVVIGILIALQINNWNEQKKLKSTELEILKELDRDLDKNISLIQERIAFDSIQITNNQKLLSIIKDPHSMVSDSLERLLGSIIFYLNFYPQNMAYENLKTRGFEIISNDSLRTQIIYTYDALLVGLKESSNSVNTNMEAISSPIFLRHLETKPDPWLKTPNDFAQLKADPEFINHLSHYIAFQKNKIRHNKNAHAHVLIIQKNIQQEIIRLQCRSCH